MEIREVFHEGQWFSIKGDKKSIRGLTDARIRDLCSQSLESEVPVGVTVQKIGSRGYTQKASSVREGERQKAFSGRFRKLQKLWSSIVEFATHRQLKEKEARRWQMECAMKLFNSTDEELLSSLFPEDPDLASQGLLSHAPFSYVLDTWVKTMEAMDDPALKGSLNQLRHLATYQKDIESLRLIKNPRQRAEARAKLNQKILGDLEKLGTGGKLYIPGGVWKPESGESLPMVYEITKSEGSYLLRAIDLSGQVFKLPEGGQALPQVSSHEEEGREGIERGFSKLIGGQKESPKEEMYLESSCSILQEKIGTAIDEATLVLSGYKPPTKEDVSILQFIPLLSIKETFSRLIFGVDEWTARKGAALKSKQEREQYIPHGEEVPHPSPIKRSKTGALTEPMKMGRIFLKTIDPEVYKKQKIALKYRYLLSMWNDAGEENVRDPKFRGFIVSNIKSLMTSLDSQRPLTKEETVLENELLNILSEIEKLDTHQQFVLPSGGETSSKLSPEFSSPLRPEAPLLPTFVPKTQSVSPLSAPEEEDISSILKSGSSSALKAHLSKLEKLASKKQYAVLHYQLKKDFLVLRGLTDDQIQKMAGDDPNSFADGIKQLGFLLQRCSYGLGRISPSAEDISFVLRGFVIQDKLARKNPKLSRDAYVTRFKFDIAPIQKILKNPYLSLGDSSSEIRSCITYFNDLDSPGKKRELFHGSWCGDEGFSSQTGPTTVYVQEDKQLFSAYASGTKVDPSVLAADINGTNSLLPPHLVHLRQSYLMLQSFVAPTRTFIPFKTVDFIRMLGAIKEEAQGNSSEEIRQSGFSIAYQKIAEKIPDLLRSREGPISFEVESSTMIRCSVISVKPWGLGFFDLDESLDDEFLGSRFKFEHRGTFDRNGIPIDDRLLRERCFEQVVAETSDEAAMARGFEDDGSALREQSSQGSRSPFLEHRMKGRTEWQILQDRARILGLDLHTSQSLQLMETGPKTIVQNTLTFMQENRALLSDKKYGPAIFRLVERNLFRNGAFLKCAPETQNLVCRELLSMLNVARDTEDSTLYIGMFGILREIASQTELIKDEFVRIQEESLKGRIEAVAAKQSNSRALYQEQLLVMKDRLSHAGEEEKRDIIQSMMMLFFKVKSSSALPSGMDPLKEEMMQELMLSVFGLLAQIPKDKSLMESVLKAVGKEVPTGDPIQVDGLVFKWGKYQIDFSRFEIWENSERQELLPSFITDSSGFKVLAQQIGRKAQTPWTATPIIIPSKTKNEPPVSGFQYSLRDTETKTDFRFLATEDGMVRLYKRREGGKWYQYEPSMLAPSPEKEKGPGIRDAVPRVITQGDCWVSEDGLELSVEKDDKQVYKAALSGPPSFRILSLEKLGEASDDTATVMNIFGQPAFRRFSDIEDQGYVVAYAKYGKVETIEYSRAESPYSYRWNSDGRRWECYTETGTGYFLSDRSLERYATPPERSADVSENPAGVQEQKRLQKLFHPAFQGYHFLEHEKGVKHPQVIMPGGLLSPVRGGKGIAQRFSLRFNKEKVPLYVFDVDPIKGLVPQKQPEGYLYLAYSLMVQGNCRDAFFYLDKANLRRPLGTEGQELFSWIEKELSSLPKEDPEIVLLQTRAFLMKPVIMGQHIDFSSLGGQTLALKAYDLKDRFDRVKDKLPEGMSLTPLELQQLEGQKERSMFSFLHSITRDEKKWEMAQQIPHLIEGIFGPKPKAQEWFARVQTTAAQEYQKADEAARQAKVEDRKAEEEFALLNDSLAAVEIQLNGVREDPKSITKDIQAVEQCVFELREMVTSAKEKARVAKIKAAESEDPVKVAEAKAKEVIKAELESKFPLIQLHKSGKISEGELTQLKETFPDIDFQLNLYQGLIDAPWPLKGEKIKEFSALCEEIDGVRDQRPEEGDGSENFNRLQVLESLALWKGFDEEVLQPFHVSLKELLFMKEQGALEKLFASADPGQKAKMTDVMQSAVELSKIRERFALRSEIGSLQETIHKTKERLTRTVSTKPTKLFADEETKIDETKKWKDCFMDDPSGGSSKLTCEGVRQAFRGEKKETETYAELLDRELSEDLEAKLRQSPDVPCKVRELAGDKEAGAKTDQTFHPLRRDRLKNSIQQTLIKKKGEAAVSRQECLTLLTAGKPVQKPTIEQRLRRVGRVDPEALFETAIRCYGENGDFTRLRELGVTLSPDQERNLKDHLKDYLKSSVQARQLQRCLEIEAEIPEEKESFSEKYKRGARDLKSALECSWQYDVESDPLAPTLLLVEYELGFVCRKSQIEVVRENLEAENRFKQEICGGGKTTVVRNIISQFRADGRTLSGVSTLEPLRREHGLMYARTTRNAFGELVFDFRFDRGVPTDESSLLHLHHDLLQATVERGRIDLSKGDLQSFKLAKNLKHEEIREKRNEMKKAGITDKEKKKLEQEIEQLHAEIDVMEDIMDFMSEHVAITADELDKDCDPTQEKNYAYGGSEAIDEDKRKAVLTIFRSLLVGEERSDPLKKLGKAIQGNKQAWLSIQERQEGLEALAHVLYDKYKEDLPVDVSEEDFVAYIIKPADGGSGAITEAEKVYKKIFFVGEKPKEVAGRLAQLAWTRKFLWETLTADAALSKTGGVNYGRAKDEVSVIPYAGSDKPKEGSEHGNDMERLVYTSFDYIQRGLSSEQIRAAYIKAKEAALQEVLVASRLGRTKNIDETKAAIEFQEKITKFLDEPRPKFSEITEEHLETIKTKVTGNPEVLLSFLEEVVLSDLRQSEAKLTSDAQDPPYMVKSYGGSSGTDTGCHALPDKIAREDARQQGVHGEVIRWLLESEAALGKKTFLEGDLDDPYAVLIEEMKGGDCVSDVGRFFPGKPPREIAETLLKKFKEKGKGDIKFIVFMNPEDKWVMLTKEGDRFVEVDYKPSEDPEILKQRVTIFDDVHTRGAERSSTAGVTEFVTIDPDSDWSRFEQGVARERNVTKGKATVRYILSPAVRDAVGDPPMVYKLKAFLTKNEAKHLQALNYKAECQKIKHILKRTGDEALRSLSRGGRKAGFHSHYLVREKVYGELREDLYYVSTRGGTSQAAAPQGEKTASKALDNLVDSQLKRLTQIQGALRSEVMEPSLVSARTPVTLATLKGNLKKLSDQVGNILANLTSVQEALKEMKAKYEEALIRKFSQEDVAIKIDESIKFFSSADIEKQIQEIKDQKKKLDEELKRIEEVSAKAESLSIDAVSPLRELCAEMQKKLVSTIKEVDQKKKEIEGKTEEVVEESEQKREEPQQDIEGETEEVVKESEQKREEPQQGIVGALRAGFGRVVSGGKEAAKAVKKAAEEAAKAVKETAKAVKKAAEEAAKAVKETAKKVYIVLFNWSTDSSVTHTKAALDLLKGSLEATQKALDSIISSGDSLTKIASDTLEGARTLLQAKLSDEKRKEIEEKEKEKGEGKDKEIQGHVSRGYGRVDARFLPDMVSAASGDQDKEQAVEQEQEQEQEKEEVSAAKAQASEKTFAYVPIATSDPSSFLQQKPPENIHLLSVYTDLLPDGKLFTENCFPVDRSDQKIRPWEDAKPGAETIPASDQHIDRTLFIVDTQDHKVVELYGSRLDGERFFSEMKSTGARYKVFVCLYPSGQVEEKREELDQLPEDEKKKFMRHVATTKLFRGDIEFVSDPEHPLRNTFGALVDYLKSLKQKDPKYLEDLRAATKRLVAAKGRSFSGSDIEGAFNEAGK
jgi:hypothetical protein